MSDFNDGGPAFPFAGKMSVTDTMNATHIVDASAPGMSLRDWFAGQATEQDVDEWLHIRNAAGFGTGDYRTREQAKYAYAAAMLEARK